MKHIPLFVLCIVQCISCFAQNVEKVANINPPVNSYPEKFIECSGKLYFTAEDGTHGTELWVTEGTAATTHMVKDITPGTGYSLIYPLTGYKNKLYLVANNDTQSKLWATDGTTQGTYALKDIQGNGQKPIIFDNRLFFLASSADIWVTDGTEAGTKRYADDLGMDFSHTSELVLFNNKLYFNAQDASGNNELWVSDGTPAGTYQVTDINPTEGSRINHLIVAGNRLFFWAHDTPFAVSYPEYKVYMSDGTAGGTKKIFSPSPVAKIPQGLYAYDNKAIFCYTDDWNNSGKVYITEGKPGTTQFLSDRYISGYFVFKNKMFFTMQGPHGEKELYTSDGTQAGTVLFDDFNFPQRGAPRNFVVNGNKFYFISENKNSFAFPVYGDNLWISDGTVTGTYLPEFKDRNMQRPLLLTRAIGLYKGEPYFGGNYDNDGMQLWKLDTRFPTRVTNVRPADDTIQVYPNPVNDKLFVKGSSTTGIEVTDMTGRVLLQQPLYPGKSVDVSSLPAGMYILHAGEGNYTRFMKQ